MARRQLLIGEMDPADPNHGRIFGLDANETAGVPIPAFKFGAALPTTGTVAGEAFIDTTSKTASVWDGNKWNSIIPASIVSYPTEAAILAAAPPVGTYAFAMDSGNLFVRYNAPTGAPGGATRPAWKNIGVTMYNTMAALLASASTAPVGELAFARDTGLMFLKEPTGWKPDSIWQANESSILVRTDMVAGQMAVALDTGKLYLWNATARRWDGTAINSPRAGVGEIIAWPTDTFDANEYLACDGQTVARAAYPDLFTAIGTTYNKTTDADATLFRLPDLRGLFLRGTGAKGGEAHAGIEQDDTTKMPDHPFTATAATDGLHAHAITAAAGSKLDVWYQDQSNRARGIWPSDSNWGDGETRTVPSGNQIVQANGSHSHTITVAGGDPQTRPKNMSIRWLIRHRAINGGPKGDKGDKGDSITVWTGTQAQYDAIATKVATTLYVIHA